MRRGHAAAVECCCCHCFANYSDAVDSAAADDVAADAAADGFGTDFAADFGADFDGFAAPAVELLNWQKKRGHSPAETLHR